MLENTESQEMYLTTIYALQKKNGMVRSVDVADERGYSKVSVHNAMKRLEEFGYVTFHQGKITLTKCGKFEEFESIIEEMTYVYKHDGRPWLIGYSGGKDSSLLVSLVIETV